MSATYWQVAAGSDNRDYSDDFLKYGLAFVGGDKQIAQLQQVNLGDILILKRGKSEILAVGYVVDRGGKYSGNGDKEWLKDYDGWHLPAYCFVDWFKPQTPVAAQGLTRGTIMRARQSAAQAQANQVLTTAKQVPAPATEPGPTESVDDPTILAFLIREGLRPSAAEELTAAFRRIRLLARYYYDFAEWRDVREHETRTFLIMPLLLALGWAEQQIKIELSVQTESNEGRNKSGRIDVACFSRPYRRVDGMPNNHQCTLILESKGFSSGLWYAPEQAHTYAASFKSCKAVIVSNGYCYKAFKRKSNGEFDQKPSSYLNLLNPQDKYPLDPTVDGCLETLRFLLPHTY